MGGRRNLRKIFVNFNFQKTPIKNFLKLARVLMKEGAEKAEYIKIRRVQKHFITKMRVEMERNRQLI